MGQVTEFSRPVRIDTIGAVPREIAVEADESERAALARRFDIASLDALTAQAALSVEGGDIRARGRLAAEVVQLCVATNVELPSSINAPFDIAFRRDPPVDAPDAGLELSESECDVTFYEGGAIDLGEAVAETLALAIDPYARAPDADAVLKQMGVLSEGAAGPFAALARLK